MSIRSKKLKILFVATETAPFAQVGGLGEVMSALPRAMRQLGHDVRTMVPKFAKMTRKYKMDRVAEGLPVAGRERDPYGVTVSNVLKHTSTGTDGAVTYFLENMEYYEKRANVYGYADDTARWVLLSRGTLEFLRRSDWVPDVIVANDWPVGFIPNLLRTEYKNDPILSRIATVFMIHNLRHQGLFDTHFIRDEDADLGMTPVPDILGSTVLKANGMRRGILYADSICAVSPTYAKEILEPELGEKLDGVLRKREDRLTGILNGIDYKKYNPATDRIITSHYSAGRLEARANNKRALQRIFRLPQRKDAFLVALVGRLDEQKGINLFMKIAEPLFANLDIQLVVVGTGDKDYRMFFKELQERYPDRVSPHLFFDKKLPKRVFAGADAVLIPSRFEPSGLVQMEAMHYGCVPIVRRTGGLADTVQDDSPGIRGTGFVFDPYEHMAFMIAIVRAQQAHRDTRRWTGIVRRGMRQDFSWKASAKKHEALYKRAIRLHGKTS